MPGSNSTLERLGIPRLLGPCPPDADMVIRFVCTGRRTWRARSPGLVGSFVTHNGTCGYCPRQADGRHQWTDTHGITAAALFLKP